VKILIVDDEKPARARLRQLVEDFGSYIVVGEAANGKEAIAMTARLAPEIVLLDIRMPGMDGIETAHHLHAMRNPPAVVFTTAYDEYAIDAFDARAIGYVLKPVRRERLERALQHASQLSGNVLDDLAAEPGIESRRNHVCARVHGELHLIPIANVRFFTADQKYVCVHHANGDDLIDDSLKSLEEEFAERFVRIHRGALVAVDSIERLEKTTDGKTRVVLRDGASDDLLVSRRHLATVRHRLRGG
jgi:two-component system response regulator AlgR